MLGEDSAILYIGKAKNLKRRVSSYFSKDLPHVRTRCLMKGVVRLELLITDTERKALLLESQLVKAFQPRYNVLLKDDKSYPYIRLSSDLFPRLSVTRDKKLDYAHYYGPYVSFGSARYLVKIIQDLFPIRDCKMSIDAVKLQPKCINLDLGRCLGPCVIKKSKEDYDAVVEDLKLFLSGKSHDLSRRLKAKMEECSAALQYEKASKYRDQINYLLRLKESRVLDDDDESTYHIWVGGFNQHYMYVLVQTIIEGKLMYQRGFYSRFDEMSFHDYVIQCWMHYYSDTQISPDHILLGEELKAIEDQSEFDLRVSGATVRVPARGHKKDMVMLAQRNLKAALAKVMKDRFHSLSVYSEETLTMLQRQLKLQYLPRHILGFDISHLSGTNIVASCVSFREGKPVKNEYRRYYIRSLEDKSNDPQSIYEVVKRRLKRILDSLEPLPQLLLIDGGKSQLNFAFKACKELGVVGQLDVISLAKKEELIYIYGVDLPVRFSRHDPCLQLCQNVRDESHRFAVSFQRLTRRKQCVSILSTIKGLGEKRIQALYKRYGSMENIVNSDVAELQEVCKITEDLAMHVLTFCRSIIIDR